MSLNEFFEVVTACLERLVRLLWILFSEHLEQLVRELIVAVAVAWLVGDTGVQRDLN